MLTLSGVQQTCGCGRSVETMGFSPSSLAIEGATVEKLIELGKGSSVVQAIMGRLEGRS